MALCDSIAGRGISQCALFADPIPGAAVIGEIPNKERCQIEDETTDFFHIKWRGTEGWIGRKNVASLVPPGGAESKTPGSDRMSSEDWRGKIFAAFRKFDTNGTGKLNRAQFRQVVQALDPNKVLSEGELDRLIQTVDVNRDGMVQVEEYLQWVMRPSRKEPGQTAAMDVD